MNATMKNITNGMNLTVPAELFDAICRINRSIPTYWEDRTDYAANKAHNRFVINGDILPESYGELVNMTIDSATNHRLADAYKHSCWYWNGGKFEFQYPSCKEVYARYLCMM